MQVHQLGPLAAIAMFVGPATATPPPEPVASDIDLPAHIDTNLALDPTIDLDLGRTAPDVRLAMLQDPEADAAADMVTDDTGTDPRDFSSKLMPYFRYTELDNGIEVREMTMFGMHAFTTRFAMTYDGPLSMADDLMVWNLTSDGAVRERMAMSTDDAWDVAGPTPPPLPDKKFPRQESEFILGGRYDVSDVEGPAFEPFRREHGLSN